MAEKLRAEPIRAVRRLLGRLNQSGTQGNGMRSALDETALQDWVSRLDPALALCGFHPFAQTDRLPVLERVVAPSGSAPVADTTQDFSQTLARLVQETQAVKGGAMPSSGRKNRLGAETVATKAKDYSASRQVGQTSAQSLKPGSAGNFATGAKASQHNLRSESALPGQSSAATTGNAPAGNLHAAQPVEVHNVNLFQQLQTLVETLQAPASESMRPTVQSVSPSPDVESVRASHTGSALLQNLTKTLLTKSAPVGDVAARQHRGEMHEIGGKRQQVSPATSAASIVTGKDSVAGTTQTPSPISAAQKAKPGLSIATPNNLLSAPTQAAPNAPTPLRPSQPFQDMGRFEVHTLADALNDYLQEQASLHGVDLS